MKTEPDESCSAFMTGQGTYTSINRGLTKREKLIFDLYVKAFCEQDVTSDPRLSARFCIKAADILLDEMNEEEK